MPLRLRWYWNPPLGGVPVCFSLSLPATLLSVSQLPHGVSWSQNSYRARVHLTTLPPFLLGFNSSLGLSDFIKTSLSYCKWLGLSTAPWQKNGMLEFQISTDCNNFCHHTSKLFQSLFSLGFSTSHSWKSFLSMISLYSALVNSLKDCCANSLPLEICKFSGWVKKAVKPVTNS